LIHIFHYSAILALWIVSTAATLKVPTR
jgi:hypothetical protein